MKINDKKSSAIELKGGKPFKRSKKGRPSKCDFEKPQHNDPNDYFGSEQLKKDVFNLPFGQLIGSKCKFVDKWPLFVKLRFHPVIPSSNTATNAATQAARALYQWIRHENSGSTNYDAPDLELYELALTNIAVELRYAKMMYRCINTYLRERRDMPSLVTQALGIAQSDFRSWTDEIALFRAKLNYLIRRISQYALPSDIPLTKVETYLMSYFFRDRDDERSQFYMYVPASYLVFVPTKYSTGGALERRVLSATDMLTPTAFLSHIEDQLDAINADEDMNTMSGDILKVYKRNESEWKLFQFEEVDENEVIEFKYDEDILRRIHHTQVCHGGSSSTFLNLYFGDIVQSSRGVIKQIVGGGNYSRTGIVFDQTNWVISTNSSWTEDSIFQTSVLDGNIYPYFPIGGSAPVVYTDYVIPINGAVLDFRHMPSSDELIEATRHMLLVTITTGSVPGTTGTFTLIDDITYGSEVIVGVDVWLLSNSGNLSSASWATQELSLMVADVPTYTACENMPLKTWYSSTTGMQCLYYAGHLDYCSQITFEQLRMANEIALFTELSLPAVLKIANK